jgi:cobalamin-dependent methionine synthase I
MVNWIKDFIWFIKESRSFMGYNTLEVIMRDGISKAVWHANEMKAYRKLTPEQREAWYLSGEGRTIEIEV